MTDVDLIINLVQAAWLVGLTVAAVIAHKRLRRIESSLGAMIE